MPRLPADIRISLKKRGEPTRRIELVRHPMGRRFWVRRDGKYYHIEPWVYLRELLLRLHDDDPRLDEMLPDQWARQHPEAVLTYWIEESRHKAAARSNRRCHARAVSRPL